MLRWCAYCQTYQGEVEPFDDYSMTHTVCVHCYERKAHLRDEPTNLEQIRSYFATVARSGTDQLVTAERVVDRGAALGLDPIDLLLGIVQPVLRQIGDRWARAEASVAEEHRVTELCTRVIRLIVESDASVKELRQAQAPAVLLTVAEQNQHCLGIRIIEVFLLRNHIPFFMLPSPTSSEEILRLARLLKPKVVAISAAVREQVHSAEQVAERLSHLPAHERPIVVVGGLALREAGVETAKGVLLCRDLETLVRLANGERHLYAASRADERAP